MTEPNSDKKNTWSHHTTPQRRENNTPLRLVTEKLYTRETTIDIYGRTLTEVDLRDAQTMTFTLFQ